MCFGLRESAEDTSNLKSITYDVLEIPEADFPFQDIRPIRIGQLRKKLLQVTRSKLKGSSNLN